MNNYFAKNLKLLREKKRLDQQEVADNLKIPRSTYSCWENGLRTPKIEQIQEIANYYNVGMDIISKDYSQVSNNNFDQYAVLFNKYKELSEEDKELIANIIETRKKQIDKELGEE